MTDLEATIVCVLYGAHIAWLDGHRERVCPLSDGDCMEIHSLQWEARGFGRSDGRHSRQRVCLAREHRMFLRHGPLFVMR